MKVKVNQKVISTAELEGVKKDLQNWATRLRDDLVEWSKKNYGFESLTPLAYELGFKPRNAGWRSLSTGQSVATDLRIYAVLFKRTGLASADPRTIPPKYIARRNDGYTLIPRAWSEEEWIAWSQSEKDDVTEVKGGDGSEIALQSLTARVNSLEKQLSLTKNDQLSSEVLWDLLLSPIISRITEGVRRELMPQTDSAVDPISDTITLLLKLLKPVVEGSRAGRDLFAQQYGRQAADLGTLLTALVHPNPETREVMITYRKQGAA